MYTSMWPITTAAIARPAFNPFDTDVDVTGRLVEFIYA